MTCEPQMFSRFLQLFDLSSIVNFGKLSTYKKRFHNAIDFAISENFPLDSNHEDHFTSLRVEQAVKEMAGGFLRQINFYSEEDRDIYTALGGDCGNIHGILLFKFLKQYYPELPVNLTIGEVGVEDKPSFEFSKEKFRQWLAEGAPEIFDCHAWITIGNDFIVDATIGTYINTRLHNKKAFGGIVYGNERNLRHVEINGGNNLYPLGIEKIKYQPVVVGFKAFRACLPKSSSLSILY